ncbi:MAG: hypothetical protein L5656_03160 [Thermanaeromonas sp.]|uniref:hypothetical protein n=1 Tax=Thermanaeromonas sp. TaxID=2003697 RepID=UPI00243C5BF5|nr:hypothetical protein [Thermanaeromonas sp.]MCG0277518.1 hypothetical protein [Thermanaeromonas sp.]
MPSILLLVTVVITALALAIIGWLKATKEVFNLSKPLVLSMTVLLVTSVLLGSRIGLSISGIAGAGELEELKKQMGVHRFWKYLASILLPRLSFFLLWLLLLGYAVKYLADLQL